MDQSLLWQTYWNHFDRLFIVHNKFNYLKKKTFLSCNILFWGLHSLPEVIAFNDLAALFAHRFYLKRKLPALRISLRRRSFQTRRNFIIMDPIQCAVCLEPIKKQVETQCAHKFCVKCLFQWIFLCVDQRDFINCPICRQHVWLNDLRWKQPEISEQSWKNLTNTKCNKQACK